MNIDKVNIKELEKHRRDRILFFGIFFALIFSIIYFMIKKQIVFSIIVFVSVLGLSLFYSLFSNKLKESARIKKIEEVFPDFLQLMSSNLRAGITIDRAMLLSARPEFYPLDQEILQVGRNITTGKDIEVALLEMTKRIKSEKISKTILLIISGIKAGGNLAILLEETSINLRERDFVEKRAASNVMTYVIFIFIAVSVGAPALFSLSGILVETLTNLLGGLPAIEAPVNIPFTLSSVNISLRFITYFSLIFIIVTDILASLILGLVSKGEEKQGLKYLVPILIISLSIFFLIKFSLSGFVSGLFG